jgi:hypothetical protein
MVRYPSIGGARKVQPAGSATSIAVCRWAVGALEALVAVEGWPARQPGLEVARNRIFQVTRTMILQRSGNTQAP